MKKWQKEAAKQKGERDFNSLIHEESRYSDSKSRKEKPHSLRDRHKHAATKREVVIERSEQ